MTSHEFIRELEKKLKKIPASERTDILSDYEEHIRIALERGKTESQAIAALGDPKMIAKSIMAERLMDEATQTRNPVSLGRAILATVSLSFFNLVIVVAPFVAIAAVLIALFAASAALIVSPLLGIFMLAAGYGFSVVFAMLFVEGVGILLLIAVWSLTKILNQWLIRYLKFNIRVAKGERNHA